MKYSKEIVLAIAPYRTIKLGISEATSYDECNKELNAELDRMPEIRTLNKAEIKKVLK